MTLIMQNKANLLDDQMNVTSFYAADYENKSNWTLGENEPKTNPIKANFTSAQRGRTAVPPPIPQCGPAAMFLFSALPATTNLFRLRTVQFRGQKNLLCISGFSGIIYCVSVVCLGGIVGRSGVQRFFK